MPVQNIQQDIIRIFGNRSPRRDYSDEQLALIEEACLKLKTFMMDDGSRVAIEHLDDWDYVIESTANKVEELDG